ncbi:hypothetical protein E2542_SST14196 [Spatholobus suberectus]|nr:hypothetical protein E2542_SST14196 [Spatholobus suberectus]
MPYHDPPLYEEVNIDGEDIEGNEETLINESEADCFEIRNEEQPNAAPSSSNINLKRKRVGKGEKKKIGTAERLQQSLDRVVFVLDWVSNTTVTGSKLEDLYSYDKSLPMLNEVLNLLKGCHLYFVVVRILTVKENMVAFFYFMDNDG